MAITTIQVTNKFTIGICSIPTPHTRRTRLLTFLPRELFVTPPVINEKTINIIPVIISRTDPAISIIAIKGAPIAAPTPVKDIINDINPIVPPTKRSKKISLKAARSNISIKRQLI